MKKLMFMLAAVAAMITTLTGCKDDNDVEWDIYPAQVSILVMNDAGQNLLDASTPGNILDETVTLTYRGETTPLITDFDAYLHESRYYLATFYGAYIYPHAKQPFICVGEWQGETTAVYDFTLTIGDKVYDISLDHKFAWKKNKPWSENHITINGVREEGNTVTITL